MFMNRWQRPLAQWCLRHPCRSLSCRFFVPAQGVHVLIFRANYTLEHGLSRFLERPFEFQQILRLAIVRGTETRVLICFSLESAHKHLSYRIVCPNVRVTGTGRQSAQKRRLPAKSAILGQNQQVAYQKTRNPEAL